MKTQTNTPTPKTPTKFTAQQIQDMLAGLDLETLNAARMERLRDSLEVLKTEYAEAVKVVKARLSSIREIEPTFTGEETKQNMTSKILAFVGSQADAVDKKQIIAGVGSQYVGPTLKRMVDAKTLTLTDGKYSVTPTVAAE